MEVDYRDDDVLEIELDMYNLTIAANMTKELHP